MSLSNVIPDLMEWLSALPADFAFLLALPFLVALAGVLRHVASRARKARREPRGAGGRLMHDT